MSFNIPKTDKKRVVIVGGGFGGLKLVNELRNSGFQVVLIDKNNYHQFLPLIYQVASAGMEPASIAFPYRNIYRKKKDVIFRKAEVRAIAPEKNLIQTSIGKLEYDYIIFAAGTKSNFFGNKNIEEYAMPMKNLPEAMGLRNALLANFERAVTCATADEREELLNIVVVGGGATGIEISGALAEMKKYIIPKDYPELNSDMMKIYLVEAADRLLPAMSPKSSADAYEALQGIGVDVMLNRKVADYVERRVLFEDGQEIPSRTFIWTSGVTAERIGNMDASFIGRGGRIVVDEFNRVKGLDNVFSIGDQCLMSGDEAYPNGHPQLAQVAIQQGNLLAANLKRMQKGEALKGFKYNDLGCMATIGRNRAVVDIGKIHFKGWFAWITWLVVHLRSILGVRNKLTVFFNWVWNYITYNTSMRLIINASKPKEIREREAREAIEHWGEDIFGKQESGK